MIVAGYQAPLLVHEASDALGLIRERVDHCESAGVEILCCPEAVLGGLADYAEHPTAAALDRGELDDVLAPLASDSVTTIVGFTETDKRGALYNSAAVFHRGSVLGVYRKLHPAINRSVYTAGDDMPVFSVRGLTFGIIICNDSNFTEPARVMAARGAKALFVPTNNGMPIGRANASIVVDSRRADVARATENRVTVIRADVAGRTDHLLSYGSSGIVNHEGSVLATAEQLTVDLVVGEIDTAPQA